MNLFHRNTTSRAHKKQVNGSRAELRTSAGMAGEGSQGSLGRREVVVEREDGRNMVFRFSRGYSLVPPSELLGSWCPAWSLPWQDKYIEKGLPALAALAKILTLPCSLPLSPSLSDLY